MRIKWADRIDETKRAVNKQTNRNENGCLQGWISVRSGRSLPTFEVLAACIPRRNNTGDSHGNIRHCENLKSIKNIAYKEPKGACLYADTADFFLRSWYYDDQKIARLFFQNQRITIMFTTAPPLVANQSSDHGVLPNASVHDWKFQVIWGPDMWHN
jgi:hypothetical protein